MLIDQERAAEFGEKLINAEDLPTTIPEPLFEGDDDASTAELLDPIAAAFAEAAAEVAANKPPPDPMAGLDVPPPTPEGYTALPSTPAPMVVTSMDYDTKATELTAHFIQAEDEAPKPLEAL